MQSMQARYARQASTAATKSPCNLFGLCDWSDRPPCPHIIKGEVVKLYVTSDGNGEYVRPLMIRIVSDDGELDKFVGIQDYTDPKQLQKLFRSWTEVVREVSIHEATTPEKRAEPLSEMVGLPWNKHKRTSYDD